MAKGNAIAAAVLAAAGNPGTGGSGPSTPGGLSPLVASYTQSYSVNKPYSPLPRPAPVFLEGAFGPFSPITAMPIDPPRDDTRRPDPRRFQYPVGWNLPAGTPGSEGLKRAPFAALRDLADGYSVARSCVDKRKAEIVGLPWDIVPTDEAERAMADDDKARADWERRRAIVKEFFSHPDSDRAKYPTFKAWLKGLLEDRFVIDAVAIHVVPPRKRGAGPFGSDIASLDLIDGSTIRPLLNTLGATPRPSAVAYQAYEWGVPRVDLMSVINGDDLDELGEPVADFRADQLIYMREDPRAFSPYGFSCIEKALLPITIGLARQNFQNDFFTEGSIPGMFVVPGPDISTPQQVRQLQDALNAMANDIGAKHRIIVLPPGSKADPQKHVALADQFDEWIVSQVAMPFGLTPMDLGVTPRVSAVQTPSESRELSQINSDKGSQTRIEPVTTELKDVIFDFVIREQFRQTDMEFSWGMTDRGKNRAAKIQEHVDLIGSGLESIDEARIDLGHTPWGLPETSIPLMVTATGPVPLSSVGQAQPQGALPAGGQQQDGPPQQGQPADGGQDDDLTTPAHGAAEDLPDTPDKGSADSAAKAAGQLAELEYLARHLRKGRPVAQFRADCLPPEALAAAERARPQGVRAAVDAAKAAAGAKRRQDRRDRHADKAARDVTAALGRIVAAHRNDKMSTVQVIDSAVAIMAAGYLATMTAGSHDASRDYDGTPAQDQQQAARDQAEEQRGFFAGLLQDIIAGLSIAAITARLGLFASTLRRAYNQAYGTTVTTAHPDYLIVWELGDAKDHCRLCVARDGKTFTLKELPGWPGDGGFGGHGAICLGGPNCRCSVSLIQGGQGLATGTNTQLPAATSYYAQQNAAITAARQQAAAERQAFADALPAGPSIRAMTRDQLRREVADLANARIRAAGGYPGVSVEPQDVPAPLIAQMLPPGLEGAAGVTWPPLNVPEAVEQMLAAKARALAAADLTRGQLAGILKAAIADAALGPKAAPEKVYAQMARNYDPEGIAWVKDMPWRGPVDVPLDSIDWDDQQCWHASRDDARVAQFAERIKSGDEVKPAVLVRVPAKDSLLVIDGHHRALACKQLGRPLPAWVGLAASSEGPWREAHSFQQGHAGKAARGYDLNPRSCMISLDLPEGLVEPVPGGVSDHHVTVVYCGPDVDDGQFAEICRRAADAAAWVPGPLSGVVSGIGTFEPSGSSDGKVPAWAGVTLPGGTQLRAMLADLSASEHKDWKPHVTLAYVDEGDNLPGPVPATPVTFTHLCVHRGDDEVVRLPFGDAAQWPLP